LVLWGDFAVNSYAILCTNIVARTPKIRRVTPSIGCVNPFAKGFVGGFRIFALFDLGEVIGTFLQGLFKLATFAYDA